MKLSLKKLNEEQKELDMAWSTMIKNRDDWCCAICGTQDRVVAHHIIPRENKAFRYKDDNGIALCVKHHKFSRVISAHNNPLAFFLWLKRFRPLFFASATEGTKQLLFENGITI